MMLLQTIAFSGFIFSLCFQGAVLECTRVELSNCKGRVKRDKGSLPPSDPAEFDRYCQHAASVQSCLEKLDCEGYMKQQWLSAIGTTEGISYLCTDNARSVFLNNAECASNAYQSPEAERCKSELMTDSMSAGYDEEKMCSALNKMMKCNYDWMKSHCGDAADVFWNWLHRVTARLAPSSCNFDDSYVSPVAGVAGSGFGRMTSSVTSSVMLFIASLLLIRR